MDLLDKLSHYLESSLYPEASSSPELQKEPYPFITISREIGAGAHSLANQLLEDMAKEREPLFSGWQVFDAAFCARLLENSKIQASLDMLQREITRSPWEETVYRLAGGPADSDTVFQKTIQAMRVLAKMGKLIVIGRGGACATARLPGGIHVRLVAPIPFRTRRLRERLQTTESNAKHLIKEYDTERAKFVRAHFGQDVRDPLLYHATWNTEQVPIREISTWLLGMVKARAPHRPYIQYDESHSPSQSN